ncbi:MAG TPA: SpvB/TcaC N-terminal domain-containing protein [Vicinamibacterales bacterium]|nr:SpvB/TcaC N-terminal domain-containing protein [Vicinamibacterales bacterium]
MSRNAPPLAIALPKGGGALSGLGEKFAPDLHTGTGNFSVPIIIPSGRGGFQPSLSLNYSSGTGNGAFGLGWGLSVPGITRLVTKGVPRYFDAPSVPDSDRFVLSGAEELVELPPTAGASPGSKRYRPRTEGLFALIERQRSGPADYWTVRTKDGITNTYGSADPTVDCAVSDPALPRKIFAWRLTESRDTFGNRVAFRYRRDRFVGTSRSWDQLYLRSVGYVDLNGPGQAPFLVSIELFYDDEPGPPGVSPVVPVKPRPDPFSDYRAGFEIRTRARCKWIVVRTHPSANESIPVRAYELGYLDEIEGDAARLPLNGVSLLSRIDVIGFDDAGVAHRDLPPLEFGYSGFAPDTQKLLHLTGCALPAESLGHPDVELVDLFGHGLPDILEFGDAARYWRNLGGGRFDRPREMRESPAGLRLSNSGVQMLDADGDGRTDLLVVEDVTAGYFPLDFGAEWNARSFRRYEQAPSFSLEDPNVRLLDLTGDGVFDALRTGTRFECYFNDARRGWLPENSGRVERRTLDDFPDVSFADPRVKLADLSGDGLQDIALVHEGRIDYWPNLGHGRWGARLTLTIQQRLPFNFDPERVILGDVDGDGAADLIYVSDREVTLWINRSGNGFSSPQVIGGTPSVTNNDTVRLLDLLGHGVPGLLWSRPADGSGRPQHFFLDLIGGVKPGLLTRMDNNLGAITEVTYRSSTTFFLRDEADRETRWRTTLPFPVQVVERVDTRDVFSGGTLTTEYRYHHGYWDGAEREFRGFGTVETIDTEVRDGYIGRALPGNDATLRYLLTRQDQSPPLLTRTWFHLGPVEQDEQGLWREIDWSDEYSDGNLLRHTELANTFLATLPAEARRDALRALRASPLRSEIYALDGSPLQDRPYTVTEHAYDLRELEPPVAANATRLRIFVPLPSSQRSTQSERGDEPLTQFTFLSAYDEVGQPTRTLEVACPRGWRRMNDTPAAPYLATLKHRQFADTWPSGTYIRDRAVRDRRFELTATAGQTVTQLAATTEASAGLRIVTEILSYYDFTTDPSTGYGEFSGLPLGAIGPFGALVRSEMLAMTPDDLVQVYGATPDYLVPGAVFAPGPDYPANFVAALPALAGYTFRPASATAIAGYFATTLQQRYDFHDGGGVGRGLVLAQRDPLNNEVSADYDFGLLPIRTRDPLGLETTGTYNLRTLLPREVVDPNGNVTRVSYSPLGLVAESWVLGKPSAPAIDRRNAGDRTLASARVEYDFLAYYRSRGVSPTRPQPIYSRAVRRVFHDSDPDDNGDTIEAREYTDGFGRLLQTRSQGEDVRFGDSRYGGGDAFLSPSQQTSAPRTIVGLDRQGAALPNVVVSGWQRYDIKGRVIEKSEPFWAEGWDFTPPTQLGEKTITHYDPRGRAVLTIRPDGSEHRVIQGISIALDDPPRSSSDVDKYRPTPWEVFVYDANDNAPRTHSTDVRTQAYELHWNTPGSMETDALGRTIASVARQRDASAGANPPIENNVTRTRYDILGNVLEAIDPLGRVALQFAYDRLGRVLWTESIDAGRRTAVLGAAGDTIEQYESKGARVLYAYDAAHRLVRRWSRDATADTLTLRERIVYGDEAAASGTLAQKQANNLRGRAWLRQDEAGEGQTDRYDFKGNALVHVRRVLSDQFLLAGLTPQPGGAWVLSAPRLDWDAVPAPQLDGRVYVTRNELDALGRIKWSDYPECLNGERYRLRPSFNRAGSLHSVSLVGPLDDTNNGPVASYVSQIFYNARGQRLLIAYGNGLLTRYTYDNKTTRLARIRTEGYTANGPGNYSLTGATLQDLAHEYDLAGNLVRIAERVPGCGIRNSLQGADALDREFGYDPLYRLISATGRECGPLGDERPWTDFEPFGFGGWTQGVANPSNAPDVTTFYRERYEYDPADNMTVLRHTASGRNGWTRYFGLNATPRDWSQRVSDWRGGVAVNWGTGGNRLTNVGDGDEDVGVTHTFDASGNLSRENSERYFEWDHANRLKVFRNQTGTAQPSVYALYLYGSNGQRIKKLVWRGAGDYHTTVFIGTAFEHQTDVRPLETRTNCSLHVMDDSARIALVRVGPAFTDDGAADQPVQYHLADHLGSSSIVVAADGATMSREEYFPYGESSFGSFARKRYRYVGKVRDEESGLHCHDRRYLASWLGRWISTDPAGPTDGLNLYVYARCSPILNSDKSGLAANEHHRVCQSCHEAPPDPEPRVDLNMEPTLDQVRNNSKVQMAGGIAMGTIAACVPFIGAAAVGILQQQGYLDRLPPDVQAGIGIGMGATGAVQTIVGVITMVGGGGIAGGGTVLAPVTAGASFIGTGVGLGIAAVGALEATAGVANVGVGLYVFAKAQGRGERVPTGKSQWWFRNVRPGDIARSRRGYQTYVLKDRNGKVLYVGKGGGEGGKTPDNWMDRVRAHIKDSTKREWIGEVDRVDVYSDLTRQEAYALEFELTHANRSTVYNVKNRFTPDEYGPLFPASELSTSARSAALKPRFTFDVDIVAGN